MSRASSLIFIFVVTLAVAFCGIGYELLIIRLLTSLSGDSVLSQSLTAGCFLLALGIGAFLYGKWRRSFSWEFLIWIEISITFIAIFALPIIGVVSIYVHSPTKLVIGAQSITLILGTLCGFELPALMEAAKPWTRKWFGGVLAANYIGALAGAIVVPLILLPFAGLYLSAWILSLISAATAVVIFIRQARFKPRWIWIPLFTALFFPGLATRYQDAFEQFYLKSYYYVAPGEFSLKNLRETLRDHAYLPRVQRFSTPYQDIDIVKDDLRFFGFETSDNFHLFIDQHKQFGSSTESIYHDTIVHGSLNLARSVPGDVLIIGGGDGLMVREFLKYPEVKSITLVELDPEMIRLAKDYLPLMNLNQNSLSSPKVHVELADGFTWLRDTHRQFDAIFVDLPHPVSTDLSRLYSYEFYHFVRRRLSAKGFLVFDFPVDGILKSSPPGTNNRRALIATLKAIDSAGFKSVAAFGSWESFLIAKSEPFEFKFDYDLLSAHVGDSSIFNLTLRKPIETTGEANSIFKPVVLKPVGGGS